jgi:hypothetical protein
MEDAASDAPTVRDGWFVWEVPGKPVSVRLSQDVIAASEWRFGKDLRRFPEGISKPADFSSVRKESGQQVVVM